MAGRRKFVSGGDPNVVKWTPREAFLNIRMCPNSVLEKFFMKKTYNAFGNKVSINPEWLERFRLEINHRNNCGTLVSASRMEYRKALRHQPRLA